MQLHLYWARVVMVVIMAVGVNRSPVVAQLPENFREIERFIDSQTTLVGWSQWEEAEGIDVVPFNRLAEMLFWPYQTENEFSLLRRSSIEGRITKVFVLSEVSQLLHREFVIVFPASDPPRLIDILNKNFSPIAIFAKAYDGCVLLSPTEQAIEAVAQKNGAATANLLSGLASSPGDFGVVVGLPSDPKVIEFAFKTVGNMLSDPLATAVLEPLQKLHFLAIGGHKATPIVFRARLDSQGTAVRLADAANHWMQSKSGMDLAFEGFSTDQGSVELRWRSIQDFVDQIETLTDTNPKQIVVLRNLRSLMTGLLNFEYQFHRFPPQALADTHGQKLLSWRVLILPYLDQEALYREFHLDEPWDSPHNKKLIPRMPAVFSSYGKAKELGMTRYLAPLTPHSVFGRPGESMKVNRQDFVGSTSDKIVLIEAPEDRAVIWTRPVDLVVPSKNSIRSIVDENQEWIAAAFADNSIRRVKTSSSDEAFLSALNPSDSKRIELQELDR